MDTGLKESIMEKLGGYGSPYFLDSRESITDFYQNYRVLADGYMADDLNPPVVTVLGAKRFLLDLEDSEMDAEVQQEHISCLLSDTGCTFTGLAKKVLEKQLTTKN